MGSFHKLARMDATAGLHTSQPWPRPCPRINSSKERMRLILTISNSSCRVQEKCSHRALLTRLPEALICALKRSVTSGKQPPQPVPARVQILTSSTDVRFLLVTASQIWLLVTLLQEQIGVSLAIEVMRLPGLRGAWAGSRSNSAGGIDNG